MAQGMHRGIDRLFEGLEKRKEEEKLKAKKFKALVAYADASGLLSKDQAEVMDVDSLDGFVKGKMAKSEMERENAKAQLEQFAKMQKMQQDVDLAGFANQAGNNLQMGYAPNLSDFYENPESYAQRPAPDYQASMTNALSAYPMAAADERFGSVKSMFEQFAPPPAMTPGGLEKDLDLLKRMGVGDAEIKKIAVDRASRAHPSGQERFDLNYSDQLLMQTELAAVEAMAQLGAFNKNPGELQKRLDEIDKKFKSRARKGAATGPKEPTAKVLSVEKVASDPDVDYSAGFPVTPSDRVRVKSPDGKVGSIPKSQLEDAKKKGYTVVE